MTLDRQAWHASINSAQSALDVVARGNPSAFASLDPDQRNLAILLAKEMIPDIGLASIPIDADNAPMLAAVLASPLWALSCGRSEARIALATQHIAKKIVSVDALACLPIASHFDSSIPWASALHWADDENSHDSKMAFDQKILNLSNKAILDSPRGGNGRINANLRHSRKLAGFRAAMQAGAELYIQAERATPASFQRPDHQDALLTAALARGMAADGGFDGPGVPLAALAAIDAARAICDAYIQRQVCLPDGFVNLMLRWGCTGRDQSSFAIDIIHDLAQHSPSLLPRPLELSASIFEIDSRRAGTMPDRIDLAWLSAAHARLPSHVASSAQLAEFDRGAIPAMKLQAPGTTHPLSHIQIAWDNTIKAGRPLPKPYLSQCLRKARVEAQAFGPDWSAQTKQWMKQAEHSIDLLSQGQTFGAFPPGDLPELESICEKLSVPLTPIEWRLAVDQRLSTHSAHAEAPAESEHCYHATAAIGMNPLAAIENDPRKLLGSISSATKQSLERAELTRSIATASTTRRSSLRV